MSNNQESEFQTVKSKRGPGPRGQRIQNKNNQNQNKNSEQNDKPRLTFKELLFELNNLKKHQHSPTVDLRERGNTYIIRMELPGNSNVKIQVRDSQFLLVSGNKANLNVDENDTVIYSECNYGNFMRRVKVPKLVSHHFESFIEDGVLTVMLEQLEQPDVTLDSRLDEDYPITPSHTPLEPLESIPEETKVFDFSSLTTGSWADEI